MIKVTDVLKAVTINGATPIVSKQQISMMQRQVDEAIRKLREAIIEEDGDLTAGTREFLELNRHRYTIAVIENYFS